LALANTHRSPTFLYHSPVVSIAVAGEIAGQTGVQRRGQLIQVKIAGTIHSGLRREII
jgi:hypothetical protein